MAKTGSPLPFATTAILFYNLYLFDHYHHVLDELIGRKINAAFAGIVQADARVLLVGGGPVLSQRPHQTRSFGESSMSGLPETGHGWPIL